MDAVCEQARFLGNKIVLCWEHFDEKFITHDKKWTSKWKLNPIPTTDPTKWDALRDLIPFVKFKKREKQP